MFSKALFKQSCKANGTMWAIITFAVCFMLACVMLISGNGNIGEVKDSVQDTIIVKEVDAQMQKRALSYYSDITDGLTQFDMLFTEKAKDVVSYLMWCSEMPDLADYEDQSAYMTALIQWKLRTPEMTTYTGIAYADSVIEWNNSKPKESDYTDNSDYLEALSNWQSCSPATVECGITKVYTDTCTDLQAYILSKAEDLGYAEESAETQEMLGSVMYSLNPNGMFNEFYTSNGESVPDDYDFMSIINSIQSGTVDEYISSDSRIEYREDRAFDGAAIFLAGNMLLPENVKVLTEALSNYGVTKEKFDSFGYTYDAIKGMAKTAMVTYRGRVEYETELLREKFDNGELSETEFLTAVKNTQTTLAAEISSSFLTTLPSSVSEALEEVGKADLYTLIVGSIFYKLAGLLLPIIYMIMASNNLISGQVDSGSMAYVLSTSTKRETVVFTQSVFLIGSLFAMFGLTTATGCICLAIVGEEVGLTFGNLILLNVGAFLVLFALSGLCFFTSCFFDRSKHSMAIGGGLSIFSLVAAMLGLFGSPVIPSVVRLKALNNFNYVTIISLFDVISIMDKTTTFIWKFAILLAIGILGYVVGSIKFTKKDLPL